MNDLLKIKKPFVIGNDVTAGRTQHADLDNENVTVKKSTNHHKRPSISYDISSKRAKGQDVMIKATPQLLQQLISSTGSNGLKMRQKVGMKGIKVEGSSSSEEKPSPSKPPTATNSVLMNLLVSGCDVSAGYYTCLPRPKVAKV